MNSPPPANFDRLARVYRALERVAFGGDLERARFHFTGELAGCERILILGEGDGRFLERLLQTVPGASVLCVDASAAMLAAARARLPPLAQARVEFRQADARTMFLGREAFDAAVTLFFLDCFTESETRRLVEGIGAALRPDARWLYADFNLPARGWRRLRARIWLEMLYTFFRLETRLSARSLPPAEALIRGEGFVPAAALSLQQDLLHAALYCRSGGIDRTRPAT